MSNKTELIEVTREFLDNAGVDDTATIMADFALADRKAIAARLRKICNEKADRYGLFYTAVGNYIAELEEKDGK